MAGFDVEPDALDQLARALDRASEDSAQIGVHVRDKTKVEGGQGLLGEMIGSINQSYMWAQQFTQDVALLLYDSSQGVGSIAKWYRETDRNSAAMLDAQRLASDPGRVAALSFLPLPTPGFKDQGDPIEALGRRPPAAAKRDWDWNVVTDSTSVSGNVRGIVKALTGIDIFDRFVRAISGDWEGLEEASREMTAAAGALVVLGNNVKKHAADIQPVWNGNAANEARLFVSDLGMAIYARHAHFEHIAKSYQKLADLAFEQFEALGNLLGKILDKIAEIGIKAAVGVATIETIVGTIGAVGAAGIAVKDLISLCYQALQIFGNLDTIKQTLEAAFLVPGGVDSGPGNIAAPPLPQMAFNQTNRPDPQLCPPGRRVTIAPTVESY